MHVVLIGLRGVGKSTVGPLLARRLSAAGAGALGVPMRVPMSVPCSVPFWDLDDLVLRRLGATSVRAIFDTSGEATWRAGESDAIDAIHTAPLAPSVIALGGGAPMVPAIANLLDKARARRAITVVHLACPLATLARRLGAAPGDRSSITGRGVVEELETLSALRTPTYQRLADVTIDADASADEVVERVARAVRA